jgi:hypothetical protein
MGSSDPGERPVNEQRSQLIKSIGRTLQSGFDAVLREPLPERWVALIKRLNEEEAAAKEH